MKRYKYREHLQNRTIEPSSDLWDKLDKKLTAHENKKKSRNWMILKIASFILLLISVGIYYYQPIQKKLPAPKIASPVSKENLNAIPSKDASTKVEIADKAIVPQITEISKSPQAEKNPLIGLKETEHNLDKNSSLTKETDFIAGFDRNLKLRDYNRDSEEISPSENLADQNDSLDAEIDQLLHNSKLKLIVNGRISSKKYVNTNALLNSVEDDLNKDLRQKLIEKVVNTLKKDKEVVTSEEN